MLTEREQTRRVARRVSVLGARISRIIASRDRTPSCGRALRGRDRERRAPAAGVRSSAGARAGVSIATSPGVSRGSGAARPRRLGPRARRRLTPAPAGPVGHHGDDDRTARPEDDAVVVARVVDPAGLVEHADAGEPSHHAVDLAGVAHVGEQVEQVAGVGRREARAGRVRSGPRPPLASHTAAEQTARGRRRSSSCRAPSYGWLSTLQRDRAGEHAHGCRRLRRARSRRTSRCRRARADRISAFTRSEPPDVEPPK